MDIVVENLYKSYDDKVVLEDYTEFFKEGQVTFIMGTSGIGKTTVLRVLMGLEKIDKGTISGIDNKKLSVVFQHNALCKNLSVISNIKVVNSKINEEEIIRNLEKLNLKDYGHKRVRELSGGMERRVAILRALINDFDLLILDEPFKGLDVDTKEKVIKFIKNRIKGKTVIIVTHDISDTEYFSHKRIINM